MPVGIKYANVFNNIDKIPKTWDKLGEVSKRKPSYTKELVAKEDYEDFNEEYSPLTPYDEAFQNINTGEVQGISGVLKLGG